MRDNTVDVPIDELAARGPFDPSAPDAEGRLAETFASTPDLGKVRVGLSAGGVIAPTRLREQRGSTYEDAGTPTLEGLPDPVPLVLVRR